MNQPQTFESSTPPALSQAALLALQTNQMVLNKLLDQLVAMAQSKGLDATPNHAQKIPGRLEFAFSYFEPALKNMFRWLFESKESTNFTYDISEINKKYLASFVSVVANIPLAQAKLYIEELNKDQDLKNHVRLVSAQCRDEEMDSNAGYSRRLGWYALVRATKPKVVVETGIDKGLGSCVLSLALLKNKAEGYPGHYYGTDINPQAGYLYQGIYRSTGTILYGDSITSLKQLNQPIDLFINDSDHSADYERREYETIQSMLSPRSLILADNAHVTDCLSDFAEKTGRKFLFFPERPKDHWYPGAGIGVAF